MDQSFLSGFEVDPHHLENKQKEKTNDERETNPSRWKIN